MMFCDQFRIWIETREEVVDAQHNNKRNTP